MEKVKTTFEALWLYIQHQAVSFHEFRTTAGWKTFVIIFAVIMCLAAIDFIIGTRIRSNASSLPGLLFQAFANWYALFKMKIKAESYRAATRRVYYVIPIASHYYLINNRARKKLNKILRKHRMIMNINDVLNMHVYKTR